MKQKNAFLVCCGWLVSCIIIFLCYDMVTILNIIVALLPFVCALILMIFGKHKITFPIPITLIISVIYIFKSLRYKIVLDEFSLTVIVYLVLGIIFSVAARKSEQNNMFGIRTVFTMEFKDVWIKTHLFFSETTLFSLPGMFMLIFWSSGWIRFWISTILFMLPGIASAIFSAVIGKPYQQEQDRKDEHDLREQIKKEQGYR